MLQHGSGSADISTDDATALTEKIRDKLTGIFNEMAEVKQLLWEAHERKAWRALGYSSWATYVKAEFAISRQHSYKLLDQGRVFRSLAEAALEDMCSIRTTSEELQTSPEALEHVRSSVPDLSARQAQALKAHLPEAVDEVKKLVAQGMDAPQAISTVIKSPKIVEGSARIIEPEESSNHIEEQSTRKRTQEPYVEFDADGRVNPHESMVNAVADAVRNLSEFHRCGPSYKALVEVFKPMVNQPEPEGVRAAAAWEVRKNDFSDIEEYVDDAIAYLQEVKALLLLGGNGTASPPIKESG
jgi:uncharacterized protein YoaH (UPF0181 family)